jgi:cell fate regulator YaaT (PSP1 superfamily)
MPDLTYAYSDRLKKVFRIKTENVKLKQGERCIISSDLGGELVTIIPVPGLIRRAEKENSDSAKLIRKATPEDEKKFQWLVQREERAFQFCLNRIRERKLPMKLVRVRYFFNEKKGIFFYTADGRIDFRQLVKDLAKEFKMRIEMRQIGVRDEAKMIGGLGVCGRELCCARFMQAFEPVTIQKAKRQRIAINPTKISGLCGRLMCCLAFEDQTRGRMYADEDKVEED